MYYFQAAVSVYVINVRDVCLSLLDSHICCLKISHADYFGGIRNIQTFQQDTQPPLVKTKTESSEDVRFALHKDDLPVPKSHEANSHVESTSRLTQQRVTHVMQVMVLHDVCHLTWGGFVWPLLSRQQDKQHNSLQ